MADMESCCRVPDVEIEGLPVVSGSRGIMQEVEAGLGNLSNMNQKRYSKPKTSDG